jgi:2'-5' RNA ligase
LSTRHRLFIGLFPDPQARVAIARHRMRWAWPTGASLPQPQRLHLTLHFLGNVEQAVEDLLRDALRGVAVEPLVLVLRAPQVWSNGVAVLLPDENEGLRALHARIGQAIGAAPGRRFTPHVTLARQAAQAFPPEASPPIAWNVRRFQLVWSQLGPSSRYEVLGSYPAD